jgi:hypothetical protein
MKLKNYEISLHWDKYCRKIYSVLAFNQAKSRLHSCGNKNLYKTLRFDLPIEYRTLQVQLLVQDIVLAPFMGSHIVHVGR